MMTAVTMWTRAELTMTGDELLPTFNGARGGSGCPNLDCDASNRHIRVLSTFEMDRVYPQKSTLPYWPIPPQATHICDKCGYVFSGVEDGFDLDNGDTDPLSGRPEVDISEYDWDPSMVYETTVREAAEELVAGAPDDADADELQEAIERFTPGLGRDDAEGIVMDSDRDVTVLNLADFM